MRSPRRRRDRRPDGAQGAPHVKLDRPGLGCDSTCSRGTRCRAMGIGVVWGRKAAMGSDAALPRGQQHGPRLDFERAIRNGAQKFQARHTGRRGPPSARGSRSIP